MSRYCHDGSCTITSQYIVTYPNRYCFASKRIDSITASKYTCYTTIGYTVSLCTLFGSIKICLYLSFLCFGGNFCHKFALWSQYHESNAKHSVSTSSENDKFNITVLYLEFHFGTFATAYPVALGLFQGISPLDVIQAIEQTLSVGRYSQAPLAHLLLYHRITTTNTHAFYYFIVC